MAHDRQSLEAALINADRAGDATAARMIASELSKLGSAPKSAMPAMVQDPETGGYAMPSLVSNAGMGTSFLSGAGRKVDQMIAGTKQLLNFGQGKSNDRLDKEQAFMEAAYQPLKNANPTSAGFGEAMPGAVASTALTPGGGLLSSVLGGAAGGALPELLSYQKAPTLEDSIYKRLGSAKDEAAIGAIGGGLGYGLTRAIMPVAAGTKGASPEALAAARQIGYEPTAAEITKSPMLQNVENYFARTPGVSGKFQAIKEGQQAAINRQAAKAIGENADNVSESVLSSAKDTLGRTFNTINAKAAPDFSNGELFNTLAKIDASNTAKGAFKNADISKLVDKGLDLAAAGKVSGEAYGAIRSELGSLANSTQDASLKSALKDVQKILDKAANDSLSAADQKALELARKQYAALKTLMSGSVTQDGNVNAQMLARAMAQGSNRTGVKTGQSASELMLLKRIGEGFKPPINPNSGSLMLTDKFMEKPVQSLALGALNALPGNLYLSGPMQRYLTNNVLPQTLEQSMIRGAAPAGLLGSAYLQSN